MKICVSECVCVWVCVLFLLLGAWFNKHVVDNIVFSFKPKSSFTSKIHKFKSEKRRKKYASVFISCQICYEYSFHLIEMEFWNGQRKYSTRNEVINFWGCGIFVVDFMTRYNGKKIKAFGLWLLTETLNLIFQVITRGTSSTTLNESITNNDVDLITFISAWRFPLGKC